MEHGKHRLMKKEEGMLQKRVKCLVKEDSTLTPTQDKAMKTGEKGKRLLQQSSHSKLLPSMTSEATARTSWASFPSLPSFSHSSFYTVHVKNFAIHLARDFFLLVSLLEVHWMRWADNSYSSRKLYEQKPSQLATLCLEKSSKIISAADVLQIPLKTCPVI